MKSVEKQGEDIKKKVHNLLFLRTFQVGWIWNKIPVKKIKHQEKYSYERAPSLSPSPPSFFFPTHLKFQNKVCIVELAFGLICTLVQAEDFNIKLQSLPCIPCHLPSLLKID